MNRAEQLTLDLLDGVLDAAGVAELEGLVAADPSARAIHLELCEQEAALRGLSAIDVSRQTMARLRQASAQPPQAAGLTPGAGFSAPAAPGRARSRDRRRPGPPARAG